MRIHKITMTVIGVVAVMTLLWQARAQADVVDRYQAPVVQKAERALNNGHPNRAVYLLQQQMARAPLADFPAQGYGLLCRAHIATGNYAHAERACDAALASGVHVGAWSHHNNRGLSRLLLDKFDAAIADFQRAVQMNPSDKAVRRNLQLAKGAKDAQLSEETP